MAARTTKAADPFAADTAESTTKENPVAETTKTEKLTVTLKGGTGFDAPWVVVHAVDAADALAQLKDESMKALLDFASDTGSYFAGLAKPAQAAASNGGAATSAPANDAGGKFCKHGQMQHKSGVKNGKTWQGFFCPTPRGTPDQCSPEFVR